MKETKVTVLANAEGSKKGSVMSLYAAVILMGNKWKDEIHKLQAMGYHTDEQKYWKPKFPCYIVGGVTSDTAHVGDADLVEYSNVMSMDIDLKDNRGTDLDSIREEIFALPYVIGVFRSISGVGYYALVKIKDGRKTKSYYRRLARLFKDRFGIKTDDNNSNPARKRFISFEEGSEQWIKASEVTTWELEDPDYQMVDDFIDNRIVTIPRQLTAFSTDPMDAAHDAIVELLDKGFSIDDFKTDRNQYQVWWHVGCDFAHFDDGLQLWLRFSNNSKTYHDPDDYLRKEYLKCKKSDLTPDELARKYCGMRKRLCAR